jgi:hypothetical protein
MSTFESVKHRAAAAGTSAVAPAGSGPIVPGKPSAHGRGLVVLEAVQ